ncbi:C4-dicarboxylate transporter/malic acid transport protein [Devosia sp. LC5]|uniref:TDT family transporter n=1 Tax=Devosia sp. LC5 TaxID=1502724 RepID=UPI0004E434CE|nr:TDT family transporter [Devosia sp. LC5]KFC65735.1 C4-dicarboxylate transporter/malic acid transport protein [Devosia sp. LC5]
MSIAVADIRPLSRLASPTDAVRFFTPNWFAATMGTGILAIALGQFPDLPLLFAAGTGLWLFNIALFTLFTALYATRWITHFSGAKRILAHSSMSMSLGCIPMGLATIINGAVLFGVPAFGTAIIPIAHALWWLDAALALACGIGVPFMMFTRQSHSPQQMTAIWLLPIVAAEVTAASGGLLLPHLGPADQLTVTLISYCLWACSVPLALGMLVVLVVRMIVHNLPDANMASSCWLALGPIATGALGMLLLAEHAPGVLQAHGLGAYAGAVGGASFLIAVLLWGYSLWWLGMAGLITLRYFRGDVPFNLGWWAFTFPLGVYAVTTLKLAHVIPFTPLMVFGSVLVGVLALVWLIVASRTLVGAWRGELFSAPCLADD